MHFSSKSVCDYFNCQQTLITIKLLMLISIIYIGIGLEDLKQWIYLDSLMVIGFNFSKTNITLLILNQDNWKYLLRFNLDYI